VYHDGEDPWKKLFDTSGGRATIIGLWVLPLKIESLIFAASLAASCISLDPIVIGEASVTLSQLWFVEFEL